MDELIRKQDALNAFCLDNRMFLPLNSVRTGAYVKMVMDNIKALPPVQPNHNAEVSKMEIVRCENCEHWDTSWETVYGLHYCPMIDMATKKNFFCKYGAERKGDTE